MLHRLFIKIPFWVRWLFPHYVWRLPAAEQVLYLTFDDGPHPAITPFVLDALAQYGAKATFFCIGKNVAAHPGIYQRILAEGHAVGNHTFNHVNGSKTATAAYLKDVKEASAYIDSHLFRPPYGRISKAQAKGIKAALNRRDARIIMWDVLSADFDQKIKPETCLKWVLKYARSGSVIVFHDSEKAFENMRHALPETLQYFTEKGYRFAPITL